MAVKEFIKQAFDRSNYDPEMPLFVVTDNEISFDAVKEIALQVCHTHHQSLTSEDDMEERDYEPVRVLWIQVKDEFTPRGLTACGALVQLGVAPSSACLKAMVLALATIARQENVPATALFLEATF